MKNHAGQVKQLHLHTHLSSFKVGGETVSLPPAMCLGATSVVNSKIFVKIQGKNSVTRTNPDGNFSWHPAWGPNEEIPIKISVSLKIVVSGPPESPVKI